MQELQRLQQTCYDELSLNFSEPFPLVMNVVTQIAARIVLRDDVQVRFILESVVHIDQEWVHHL